MKAQAELSKDAVLRFLMGNVGPYPPGGRAAKPQRGFPRPAIHDRCSEIDSEISLMRTFLSFDHEEGRAASVCLPNSVLLSRDRCLGLGIGQASLRVLAKPDANEYEDHACGLKQAECFAKDAKAKQCRGDGTE